MFDLDAEAKQWNDHALRFGAFMGVSESDPDDKFFLVMGMTGSGKSSFISCCVGQDVTIGHGLYSCTSELQVYSFVCGGRRIHLIDTPGFDDTNRSDLGTLDILATYLGASYANRVHVHGILMLHAITGNRMNGSSLRNIEMMKAVCGFANYESLIIATTMWPQDPCFEVQQTLNDREKELRLDDRFFGSLITRGASMLRHNDGGSSRLSDVARSAQRIVSHLLQSLEKRPQPVLQLQREMIDENMTLAETKAGQVVTGELYKARREYENQLQDIKIALQNAATSCDLEHAFELEEIKVETEANIRKIKVEQEALKRTMRDLDRRETRALEQKMNILEEKFQERVAEKEQELLDMEDSLVELRKDVVRQSFTRPQEPKGAREDRVYEEDSFETRNELVQARSLQRVFQEQKGVREDKIYEEIVDETRMELVQARNSQQAFREQKKANAVNGLVNGVAAGTTSGMITAAAAAGLLCAVM